MLKNSKRMVRGLITAFALGCIATAAQPAPAKAQTQSFPDPSDTAKLYDAAKKEGLLVWYTGSDLSVAQALADAFQKKYPGISIEPLRLGAPQIYARFNQERSAGKDIVDIMSISDKPSMDALVKSNMIAQWKVPTSSRIPQDARIGDYSYADHYVTLAIGYNVNKVSPDEVKILASSWKGILDPRFKGRIAVTTMKCGTCYAPINMFLDPKYKDQFGPDFLKQVAAQQPGVFKDILVSLDRVVAGEYDIVYWTFEGIAGVKYDQGAPIRWVLPSPTPVFANSFTAISAYAPHPNAARLFMDWFMSDEGAVYIQKLYSSSSTLQGVPDSRDFTKASWYHAPTVIYSPDFDRWKLNYDKDEALWAQDLKAAQ